MCLVKVNIHIFGQYAWYAFFTRGREIEDRGQKVTEKRAEDQGLRKDKDIISIPFSSSISFTHTVLAP